MFLCGTLFANLSEILFAVIPLSNVTKHTYPRSPDSVAATKELFQSTWVADEETCFKKETDLQTKLIATW